MTKVFDVVFVVDGRVRFDQRISAVDQNQALVLATLEAIEQAVLSPSDVPEVHVRPFA